MNPSTPATSARKVFSVSELTREIKQILEKKYALVWISGEISNLSKAASGHVYLTLKDRDAQISGVIFRNQARLLKQKLENGMQVTGLGRISLYEPRGTYQIILEYLERNGIGELLAELEALKQRLKSEGLFDVHHKKTPPFLPGKIAVITSPTGAAIEDILTIAQRRFDNIPIDIVPVSVQGETAADEIVKAIRLVNEQQSADVIILARGGGSLEDLKPFNSERVARALFAAAIPVVSGVGHETDYTLADFVADVRAPTPSAAAELVLPVKSELAAGLDGIEKRLAARMQFLFKTVNARLADLSQRLVHPRKRLDDAALRLDEFHERLIRAVYDMLRRNEIQLDWWVDRIAAFHPEQHLKRLNHEVDSLNDRLVKAGSGLIEGRRIQLQAAINSLNTLNPDAVLKRGYSITRLLPEQQIVRNADQVPADAELEIILADGKLRVKNMA